MNRGRNKLQEFIDRYQKKLYIKRTGEASITENVFGLTDRWLFGKPVAEYEDKVFIGFKTASAIIVIHKSEVNNE